MRNGQSDTMCRYGYMCVYSVVLLIHLVCVTADGKASVSSWHRTITPQQSLLGLMVSIDETLRNLAAVRWDVSLEQIDHRLEALEIKIRRLDTQFQDRLDKIERQLNSRDLKADISEEKLSHKIREVIDSNYDRYNRRLTYTEERFELVLKKLETTIVEGSLNRLEKQQEDIQSEMIEIVTTLDELKLHSVQHEDKFNSSHKTIQQHLQTFLAETPSRDQLQKISGSLEHIGNKLNNSVGMWGSQNDGPLSCTSKDLMDTISVESHKIGNKMSNMYNDVWRRLVTLETQIKDVIKLSNATQKELLDEFRTSLVTERKDYIGDSQENFLEVALDALERKLQKKLSEVGRKLDDKFDTMSATQNLVMDSCFEGGGICQGLESRVSQVLEKIVELLSHKIDLFSNGTMDIDNLLVEMMELVKSQHNQLIRTVSHTTNMVVTLTKEASDANKQLQLNIGNIAERTEANFQEIQEEMQEITNLNGKVCSEVTTTEDETKQRQVALNITEIHLPLINLTISKIEEKDNTQTKGILKITTDNLLSDNKTNTDFDPSSVEQYDSKSKNTIDDTTQELMGLLNPNLTSSQIEGLMHFLNNTMNLKNIEAIIQNTQAEQKMDNTNDTTTEKGSVENSYRLQNLTDFINSIKTESLSKTENENSIENSTNIDMPTAEKVSTNITSQNETATVIQPTTEPTTNQSNNPILNQIQLLSLIVKIQKGMLNASAIINSYDPKTPTNVQINYLKSLCFGSIDVTDLKMLNLRKIDRLLNIKSVIKTKRIYEEIENICNMLIDKLKLSDDNNKQ